MSKIVVVSALVVVRNEVRFIERCVGTLIRQDLGQSPYEIIIVDGQSSDGTREAAERMAAEHAGRVRVFDNPKKTLASGWNIGIREARGEFVCRIDAHSEISPSYISNGVYRLLEPGNERVAGVGGWCQHRGTTPMGATIAALLSSTFAVGDSPFRQPPPAVLHTDTAVYAVYRRGVFSEVGCFDEALARNQDMVMHHRVRAAGYTLLTHPRMEATYYVRSSVAGLVGKAFKDGAWVAVAGSGHFCLRHKVPFLFVIYLGALVVALAASGLWLESPLGEVFTVSALVPIVVYGICALFFALKAPCAPLAR